MGKKRGGQLYVPPIIIEEMEVIMREENLTVKAEALRKVGRYAKIGRKVNQRISVNDLDKIIPKIPIGEKIRPKKVNLRRVLGL
jgi:hypothetical protein